MANTRSSLKRNLDSVSERIASFQSLHPETSYQLTLPIPSTAKEAISQIGALYLVAGSRYWETDKAIRNILNQCYRYQYEGDWMTVQEILEQTHNFSEYESWLTKNRMNSFDLYGNLYRKIANWIRLIGIKPEKQVGKVKKKVRRRGYNDKGTSVQPHLKRNVSLLQDDRVDRRGFSTHPLLRNSTKSEGNDWTESHPIKRKEDLLLC